MVVNIVWGSVIDLVLVLILLLEVIFTGKKGFIKSISTIIAFAAAFGAAYYLSAPVAQVIDDKLVGEKVKTVITEKVNEIAENESFQNVEKKLTEFVEKFNLKMEDIVPDEATETVKSFTDKAGNKISLTVSKVLAFILVMAVVYVIVLILFSLLDKVFSLKFIKSVNTFFGIVFGVIKGGTLVLIVYYALMIILPLFSKESILEQSKAASLISQYIFNK